MFDTCKTLKEKNPALQRAEYIVDGVVALLQSPDLYPRGVSSVFNSAAFYEGAVC